MEKTLEENFFKLPVLYFELPNFDTGYNPKKVLIGKENLYLHLVTERHDFSEFRKYESERAHEEFNSMLKTAMERRITECSPLFYSYEEEYKHLPKNGIGYSGTAVGKYIKIKQPTPQLPFSEASAIAEFLSNVFDINFYHWPVKCLRLSSTKA